MDSIFDNTYADVSFSAGAHFEAKGEHRSYSVLQTPFIFCVLMFIFISFHAWCLYIVGFELHGSEFTQVPTIAPAEIASRAYIQFNDVSAKFTTTARVFGDMDIANIGNIEIEDGMISFAFGLGMIEMTDKIYFNEVSSVPLALKNTAEWQTAAVMDVSIPIAVTLSFAEGIILKPVISITSSDLFTPDLPYYMSIDLNLL